MWLFDVVFAKIYFFLKKNLKESAKTFEWQSKRLTGLTKRGKGENINGHFHKIFFALFG